jgi:hypothetical protein
MRYLPHVSACALMGVFATAHAADNGVYAGLAVGQSTTDVARLANESVDEKDTGFKLILGLRPLDWVGVEVDYIDLGEVSRGNSTTGPFQSFTAFRLKETGFGATGVLFYDIANVDLFAKAGLVRWDGEATLNTFFGRFRVNDSGTDLRWGAGAQVRLGSLAARLEYERFEIDEGEGFTDGKPQMVSLGVTWTFF